MDSKSSISESCSSYQSISSSATEKTSQSSDSGSRPKNTRRFCHFWQLYRYADKWDVLLMVVGLTFATAEALSIPAGALFHGLIINIFMEHCSMNATTNSSGTGLFNEIGPLSGYYALTGLSIIICGTFHIFLWTVAGQRQVHRIRCKLFQAILSKDAAWFDDRHSGALTTTMFDGARKIEEAIGSVMSLTFSHLSSSIFCMVFAGLVNWKITAVIFLLAPLLFLTGIAMITTMRKYSSMEATAYEKAGSIACGVIGNYRTVAAFNRQEYEVSRYKAELKPLEKMSTVRNVLSGLSHGVALLMAYCIQGIAFWWGHSDYVQASAGEIAQIVYCIIIGTTLFIQTGPNFQIITAALKAAESIFSIIDEDVGIDNFSNSDVVIPSTKGEISFENVSFAYPSRPNSQVLKGINVKIGHGQRVAFVGPSGSGKSTIVQLLLRLYDCDGGSVKLDGIDIRRLNVRWLRQQIGFVGQEPVLFNISIRDNVRLGARTHNEVSDYAIVEACKMANAHGFISSLPDGYDTIVGTKGTLLSGGQKQRIAIARAIIGNPAILVLDEATSALDGESEFFVQKALEAAQFGRTSLVIAHRLSTIRNADVIVVVEGGEVVETGSHESLLEAGGVYCRYVQLQTDKTENRLKQRLHSISQSEEILSDSSDDSKTASVFDELKSNLLANSEAAESSKACNTARAFWKVLSWGKPEVCHTVACVFITLLIAMIRLLLPLLIAEFLNLYCLQLGQSYFTTVTTVVITLAILATALMGIQHYLYAIIADRLSLRMRCRFLTKVLCMDAKFHERDGKQSGVLSNMLTSDCIDIQGMSGVRLCLMIYNLLIVSTIFTYGMIEEYRMTLALSVIMPVIIFSVTYHVKSAMDSTTSTKEPCSVVTEVVGNMKTVVTLTAEEHFLGRFTDAYENYNRAKIKEGVRSGPILSLTGASAPIAASATFAIGSYLVGSGETTFVVVMRMYFLILHNAWAIARSDTAIPSMNKAYESVKKLLSVFQLRSLIDQENKNTYESYAADELRSNRNLAKHFCGKIEFRNVTFSYPNRTTGVPVLKNVSFEVAPGQRVAICGPSGSGKSTIVSLIQRFYDPVEGSILVDGVDIRQRNVRALRSNISSVAQEPGLVASDVFGNIVYGSKFAEIKPSDGEVRKACRDANASGFIRRLPQGMLTSVGEHGSRLSGGQKQRIALARALVKNPAILLLDEATSALDIESEKIVQSAIESASVGRTTIAIAHRLSTIEAFDHILVMDSGEIVEEGSHAELMAQRGLYCKLQNAAERRKSCQDL